MNLPDLYFIWWIWIKLSNGLLRLFRKLADILRSAWMRSWCIAEMHGPIFADDKDASPCRFVTQAGVAFCSEPPRHERDGQEAAEGCEGDGSRRELGLVAALVCEHDDHRADGHAECDGRDADERR